MVWIVAKGTGPRIPLDTFASRLAVMRADAGGLNIKRAAERCGLSDQSWRTWESGRTKPRDYLGVCRRIAEGLDYDLTWIAMGGPLPASSTKWYSHPLRAA
jgi:transcriptional regulator with XRE-family HTH domain